MSNHLMLTSHSTDSTLTRHPDTYHLICYSIEFDLLQLGSSAVGDVCHFKPETVTDGWKWIACDRHVFHCSLFVKRKMSRDKWFDKIFESYFICQLFEIQHINTVSLPTRSSPLFYCIFLNKLVFCCFGSVHVWMLPSLSRVGYLSSAY